MDPNFLGHPSAHWLAHEHSHQVHRQNIILHYYTTIQCTVFQASIFTARQGQGCTYDQDSVFQKSRRYIYRIYLQVRLAFTTSCTFALNKSHWMISWTNRKSWFLMSPWLMVYFTPMINIGGVAIHTTKLHL